MCWKSFLLRIKKIQQKFQKCIAQQKSQLDNILYYLIYNHLEETSEMFLYYVDGFLKAKEYRQAVVSHYNDLELFKNKL